MVSNIDNYFAYPFIYTDVNTRTDGVNKVQTIDWLVMSDTFLIAQPVELLLTVQLLQYIDQLLTRVSEEIFPI